jgi:hypothetical protein
VGSDQEHKGELDLRGKKKFSRGYNSTPISSRPKLSSIFRFPMAFVRNREQASSSSMRCSKLAEPTSASARQAKGRFATTPAPRSRDEEDFGRKRGNAHVSMHTSPSVVRRGGGSRGAFADESRTNCAVPLRRKSELFVFRTNCTVRRRLGNLSVVSFSFFFSRRNLSSFVQKNWQKLEIFIFLLVNSTTFANNLKKFAIFLISQVFIYI